MDSTARELEAVLEARGRRGVAVHDEGLSLHVGERIDGRDRIEGPLAARSDIDRVLEALGIPTEPPAIAPARAPPQQTLHLCHRPRRGIPLRRPLGPAAPRRLSPMTSTCDAECLPGGCESATLHHVSGYRHPWDCSTPGPEGRDDIRELLCDCSLVP